MTKIEVHTTVEEALKAVDRRMPDAFGCIYHTFRLRSDSANHNTGQVVSRFVASGWHLLGGPLAVPADGEQPEHLLISMVRLSTRPMMIRGEVRGEMRGEIVPER